MRGRKQLDKQCCDRPVDHRHIQREDEQDGDHQRLVDRRCIGSGRIARFGDCGGQSLAIAREIADLDRTASDRHETGSSVLLA